MKEAGLVRRAAERKGHVVMFAGCDRRQGIVQQNVAIYRRSEGEPLDANSGELDLWIRGHDLLFREITKTSHGALRRD